MNQRVGQLAFPQDPNAMPGDKPYSDATAEAMDEEARAIVDAAYQRTLALVREKKDQVEKIANLLLDKETITHDDMIDQIGERPFQGDAAYTEYVSRRQYERENEKRVAAKKKEEEQQLPSGDEGLTPGLAFKV
jgi:AFG3 family protein